MPKWNVDGAGVIQTKTSMPRALGKQPSFDVKTRKGFDDQLAGRIEELAKASAASKEPTVASQTRSRAGLVGRDAGVAGIGGAEQLDKARNLIDQKKFKEALAIIDKVLQGFRGHTEATYLKGLCQYSLAEHDSALETLGGLTMGPDTDLGSRVRILRAQIRQQMLPMVTLEVLAFTAIGQSQVAVERLGRLLKLDPDAGLYHILLVRCHLTTGSLHEAAEAVQRAEPRCQGQELTILQGLSQEIERRSVERMLDPARRHYLAQAYRKARKAMELVQPQCGNRPLFHTLSNYLSDLGGGVFSRGSSPVEVVPRGTARDVEEMHFFLVGELMRRGKELFSRNNFAEAEELLREAQAFAPHFPYVNFLLAACLFKGFWAGLLSGGPPPLDEASRKLRVARDYAAMGAADPEIAEAGDLVNAIEGTEQMVREIRAEFERQEREAAIMGPLIREFVAIVDSGKEGIGSVAQLRELQTRMDALRRTSVNAARKIQSDSGQEQFQEFLAAIDRNRGTLDELEPQMKTSEEIGGLYREMDDILGNIKSGVHSVAQIDEADGGLSRLQQETANYRRANRHLPDEAGEAMDNLEAAIKRYKGELATIRGDVADGEFLAGATATFNYCMETANNAKGDYYSLTQLKREMEDLQTSLANNRYHMNSERGRQQHKALTDAVANVLNQVRHL